MFAFGNPVVGGSTLVRPAIQSPGFASGSAGWRVARDGSAEFNNVTIRNGLVVGSTSLVYFGTPGFGHLVSSDSYLPGNDQYGNAYLGGGLVTYSPGTTPPLTARSYSQGGERTSYAATAAGPWLPGGVYGTGPNSSVIYPTSDATGALDFANISAELNSGSTVSLAPGAFYLSAPLAWTAAELVGSGDSTKIIPGSSWTPGAIGLLQPGSDSAVRNLAGFGGSTTRSSNRQAHFITPTSTFWRVENIRCDYMNGNIINCAPVTGSHGTIFNVKGEHNGGGVSINNGAGAGVTAEINIGDLDIQNCELNPVLLLSAVNDIRNNGPLNGSVIAGAAVNCITVEGACQSIDLGSIDVGGGSGAGVLVFAALGGNSPTDCQVRGGVVQDSGGDGVVVSGACARLSFTQLMSKGNQGSGWTLANTGAFNTMTDCAGNTNNKAAGVAYDVNVTGTGHWKNEGFGYVSGAVTAGRFLAAGNNYTESNPPASMTTAGAAPGGW